MRLLLVFHLALSAVAVAQEGRTWEFTTRAAIEDKPDATAGWKLLAQALRGEKVNLQAGSMI